MVSLEEARIESNYLTALVDVFIYDGVGRACPL